MKIGVVTLGGVARAPEDGWIPVLHWLIERLARRHEVHVFSLTGAPRPDRYPFLGATVHHAGRRPRRLRSVVDIVTEHRRSPFDLLHAFWVVPAGLVAAAAGRLLRRPVLIHVIGGEVASERDIGYGGLARWRGHVSVRLGLWGASRLTGTSAPVLDSIRRLGWEADRVPLGVDLERWPVAPPRPRRPDTPARLVHVASLNRVKDQTTLLHAARLLADRGIDFQLDVAGPDTLGGEMIRLSERLGVSGRVHFHGYLPQERVHSLVCSADLMWLSSRFEGGPLAVLEAAVAGVPTVGTAVGHVAEWAPDAAVAVPVRDAAAMARETATLLEDDERRLALAHEAQRRALASDMNWTAARFEALYAGLVNGSDRRP